MPVFDEHDEFDKGGRLIRRFDVAKLATIARNCNERFAKTGDAVPLTLGHTIPGAPEKYQPEIVGYARNFRVGRFGKQQKPCILADFYFYPSRYGEAMKYPRRSVELYPRDLVFDPIALLKRTPQLDLGILDDDRHQAGNDGASHEHFAKRRPDWNQRIIYSFDEDRNMADAAVDRTKESTGTDNADLSPEFKDDMGKKQMDDVLHYSEEPPPDEVLDDEDKQAFTDPEGELDQDHAYTADRYAKHHYSKHPIGRFAKNLYMRHKYKKHYEMGGAPAPAAPPASPPGGNNTSVPGLGGAGEMPPPASPEEPMQMSKHYAALSDRLATLEKQIKDKDAVIERLVYGKAKSDAAFIVAKLAGEGYQFDQTKEVERMSRLEPKQREDRANEIRQFYKKADEPDRAPVGDHLLRIAGMSDEPMHYARSGDEPSKMTREQRDRALLYSQQNPAKSWEECIAYVRSDKTA